MKSYKLIHQLLDIVEKFETATGNSDGTIRDFTGFLINHLQESASDGELLSSDVRFGKNEQQAQKIAFRLENNVGRLFIYMSRYAKSYIKKALEGSGLQTAEEFTALSILFTHNHLLKSELITRNIQEKTSGTEVIRRLIAAGFIEQYDDEKDKRGKRVTITQKGRELLYKVFEHMSNVGTVVNAKLTLSEKLTLQYLLQKLEDFHYPIHENKTVSNKEDLRLVAESLS